MPADYDAKNAEILAALDIIAEYKAMGVRFIGGKPRSSGWISCHAIGRDDTNASAAVSVTTGRYKDSGGGEAHALSLWEFASRYGNFADWQEARREFAKKTGVKLGRSKSAARPEDQLEFSAWTAPLDMMGRVWCAKKQPICLDALKLCGGQPAWWRCYTDKKTKQRRRGKNRVIAMPCFSPPELTNSEPCGWVAWNITGANLIVNRGRDLPPEPRKMQTLTGSTAGLMGRYALDVLADEERRSEVERVYKVEGPTDMLGLLSCLLCDSDHGLFRRHLVVCNAGGSTQDISPDTAAVFAGLNVVVIHDSDKPGEIGCAKWIEALRPFAASVAKWPLPFEIKEKHGEDVRFHLAGKQPGSFDDGDHL